MSEKFTLRFLFFIHKDSDVASFRVSVMRIASTSLDWLPTWLSLRVSLQSQLGLLQPICRQPSKTRITVFFLKLPSVGPAQSYEVVVDNSLDA